MTERSLINAQFDGFLFSAIGEEKNEMQLSVLSALARVDVDPWEEAARLTRLPKVQAAQSLASMIEGLPGGKWAPSDCKIIAARLVELLPGQNSTKYPSAAANIDSREIIRSHALVWLILGAVWGSLLFAGNHEPATGMSHSDMSHTDTRVVNAASPPLAPLRGSD